MILKRILNHEAFYVSLLLRLVTLLVNHKEILSLNTFPPLRGMAESEKPLDN
jgi:hypothetical protein